jgi:hypothetical protein
MKRLLWQLRKPATRTHQARDEIRRWMLERGSSLFAATYLHSRRYPAYYYIVHSHCWRLCSNNDSQSDLEIGSALSNRCQRGTWLKAQRFQLPRLSFRLLQPRDTDIASIAESRSPAADQSPRRSNLENTFISSPRKSRGLSSDIIKTSQARMAEASQRWA